MRSLLYTAGTRRYMLLLSLCTLLSLAGLLKLISHNNEKRKAGDAALQQSNLVLENIERIRTITTETESFLQSYLLTGNQQWKTSYGDAHERLQHMLEQTAAMEDDAMQQQKFRLLKQALEQKTAFHNAVIATDYASSEATAAIGFAELNKRLTQRVQSPLNLIAERQQLLIQRRTDEIESAATHASFVTIFLAVLVYTLILAALWQHRNRVQPGPVSCVNGDEKEVDAFLNELTKNRAGFRGVFSISGREDNERRQEGSGIVRLLWSKAELEKNFGYNAAKLKEQEAAIALAEEEAIADQAVPEWKAAGWPEQLTLHFNQGNDQHLGHAVNANFYHSGPMYNRPGDSYLPGGASSFRVMPIIPDAGIRESQRSPLQEQQAFELGELIKKVLQPFYAKAEDKNIRLLHSVDPGIAQFLFGDEKRLKNILHCMLEHAMRTTCKGYIQLTVKALSTSSGQAEIAFSVADTGRGLDSEQMDDFLRGRGSKVPTLYHAKKLAEAAQSQLSVHSTEEDGTVCCFIGKFSV